MHNGSVAAIGLAAFLNRGSFFCARCAENWCSGGSRVHAILRNARPFAVSRA